MRPSAVLSLLSLLALHASAQTVEIRSEFWTPTLTSAREVISPAVARNAFTTFRVIPKGATKYNLCIAANPDDVFKVTVYGPDNKPLPFPCADDLTEPVLTLDVWTPADASVARTRLEAQMWFDDRWIIYPLEVRVQDARVPEKRGESWSGYLCGKPESAVARTGTSERNYRQDAAMARSLEPRLGRETLVREIVTRLGAPTPEAWCKAPRMPSGESYLKLRDYLYSVAQPVQ
ncbi:MAG: hypothetical protein EXQ52_05455 [Bryobacterales bacterium]|nr:hypothetical protein [Bryobacterales bacterium]